MWIYKQSTGELFDKDILVATGYAGGNGGQNLEGRNNPDMQNVKSVGPLPQGLYTQGKPVMQSHLGPYAIPLIPDPNNEMFGRSAFYMHGDSIQKPGCASEGCVIVPRSVRERFVKSGETLKVVR